VSPSHLTDIRALELSGKLLNLPKWLESDLRNLVKLTLSATALSTDNLLHIRNLSSLFSLTFFISEKQDPAMAAILEENKSASGGGIFVPAGGFSKLKLLRVFVPVLPSLTFAKEATPQLERIELRFKKFDGIDGMEVLGMLRDVVLTVDGQASERTKSVLKDMREGKKRSSKYTFIVNQYHD
jgi:disease resistance protein RPM1